MGKNETRASAKSTVLFRDSDELYAVAVSPDGRRYLSAGGSVTMKPDVFFLNETKVKDIKFVSSASTRIWNTGTRKLVGQFFGHSRPVVAALFLTDDKIATLSFNGELIVTCLLTKRVILSGNSAIKGRSESLGYFAKHNLLVTSMGDESVRGWDAESGQERFVLCGHERHCGVWSVAAHPSKDLLASGGGYGLVILWDIHAIQSVKTIAFKSAPWGVAWHPDGIRLFVATEGSLAVCNSSTAKIICELDAEFQHLRAVTVSPDGALVAAAGGGVDMGPSSKKNSIIHIWNTKNWQKELRFSGHSDMVRSLAFTKDGKNLLSASWDGTLRLWKVI